MRRITLVAMGLALALTVAGVDAALAQSGAASGDAAVQPSAQTRSLLDLIKAGGIVGYVIILLSLAAGTLVVDSFLRVRTDKLLPPSLVTQLEQLTRQGKFNDILMLTRGNDSMLGRVVAGGISRGEMGLPAIREALQEHGARELTRLHQRIGYINLAAASAPMLGLLGTVTGMISSFNVLGMAKGAARPDELAVGISEALVTTCMGLVVALPLMFLHNHLRDRVTRIGQETAGLCERLLRNMAVALETRMAARAASTPSEPARQA